MLHYDCLKATLKTAFKVAVYTVLVIFVLFSFVYIGGNFFGEIGCLVALVMVVVLFAIYEDYKSRVADKLEKIERKRRHNEFPI